MEITRIDIGLAVLRIVTGFTFAAHGARKLFEYGVTGVTASVALATSGPGTWSVALAQTTDNDDE